MRKVYLGALGLLMCASTSFAQYCTVGVGPTSTFDSNLESAQLVGETLTITYTGCPGVTGVEDQTGMVADVVAGNMYALDVTWGTCSAQTYGSAMEAWIDFDGSQTFDPGESLGTGTFNFGDPSLVQTYNFTVPLTALNGTHRMRLMHWEGGALPLDPCASFVYGSVTDFSITISGGSNCGPATGLSASNITGTTADLSWTPDGGSTGDNVEWGLPGFTPGTGSEVGSATGVVGGITTATGLSPTTTYEYYVQTDCGVGGMAGWAGPYTFTTPLASLVCGSGAPFILYQQDFEGGFPGDWTNSAFGNPQWTYNTGFTGSTATGPSAAHSGTGYVYLETSGGTAGNTDTLISPPIDLSSVVDAARLTFYYHMYGATMDQLEVLTSTNGVTWTNQWSITGQQQTSETDPWTPVEIDLTPYTGGMIWIRFVGTRGTSFTGDMAVDLVTVEGCVTCPGPTAFTASNITSSSVDLSWTESGTATNWLIEYGPSGFTPGTGTVMPTTNNPETITGLSELTDYDFYVRADCGGGDTSGYVGPVTISTPLSPLNCALGNPLYLLQEDFENPGIPAGWSNSASTNPQWQQNTGFTGSGNTGPSAAESGTGYLYLETSAPSSAGDADTLNLPLVNLSSTVDQARMTFYYHMYGATIGEMIVEVSTDGGANYTQVWSQVGQVQTDELDPWTLEVVDLTPFAGNPLNIRFIGVASTSFTGDMAIDLVEVQACISCPEPSGLMASNPTTTSVDLDWTPGGTESAWVIEYGPTGFTPGTGTMIGSTNNVAETVSGLIDNTTYDFYVYADCGGGDTSIWIGPVTETTGIVCPAPTGFMFTYTSNDTVAMTWTPGGLESQWNVEYGPLGFTPGTGTGHVATILPDTITGLPNGVWEFYVQAECGGGLNNPWTGPLFYATPIVNDSTCDATTLTVDGISTLHSNINATEQVGSPVAGFNTVWFRFVAPPSGHVEISTCGDNTSINTMFELYETANCSDFGTFNFITGASGNPFTSCTGAATPAGANVCGLTPGNTYYMVVGSETAPDEGLFHVTLTELPSVNAGTANPQNVCEDNAAFDLFTTITGNLTTNGQWYNPVAAPGNEFASTISVVGAPAGTYTFEYVDTEICGSDTVTTSITVIELPNVGVGSTINAGCNFGAVNLYDGLSGTVDLGGTWYDDQGTDLGGGTANFDGEPAGTYTYYYVVDNGTCAADSATVMVDVIDCTNIGENGFEVVVYPNPVNDLVFVQLANTDNDVTVQLIDIQGQVVTAPQTMNSNIAEINVADLADGIYFIRVTDGDSVQEVKIVKQ